MAAFCFTNVAGNTKPRRDFLGIPPRKNGGPKPTLSSSIWRNVAQVPEIAVGIDWSPYSATRLFEYQGSFPLLRRRSVVLKFRCYKEKSVRKFRSVRARISKSLPLPCVCSNRIEFRFSVLQNDNGNTASERRKRNGGNQPLLPNI